MKFYKILALIVSACVLHQTVYSMTPGMIAKLREQKAAEKAAAAAAAAVGGEGGAYDAPRVAAMPPIMAPAAAAASVRRSAATVPVAAAVRVPAVSFDGLGREAAPVQSVDDMVRTLRSLPDELHDDSLDQMLAGREPMEAEVLREQVLARLAAPAAAGGAGVDASEERAAARVGEAKRAEAAVSDECCICYGLLDDESDAFIHKVGAGQHSLHASCLEQWLEKSYECPVCKLPLTKAAVRAEMDRVKAENLKARKAPARKAA